MLIFTSNRLIVIIVQSLANSRLQVKAQMKDLLVFIVAAQVSETDLFRLMRVM
jgi:hypothetical protein